MKSRNPRRHRDKVEERFNKPADGPAPRPTQRLSTDAMAMLSDKVFPEDEIATLITRFVEQMEPGEEMDVQEVERIVGWARRIRFENLMLEMVLEGRIAIEAPTDNTDDIIFKAITNPDETPDFP